MFHRATPRSDVDDKPMTHRRPSDQNEAVRQWSRQTDPVERAMTRRPSMLTRSPSKDEGSRDTTRPQKTKGLSAHRCGVTQRMSAGPTNECRLEAVDRPSGRLALPRYHQIVSLAPTIKMGRSDSYPFFHKLKSSLRLLAHRQPVRIADRETSPEGSLGTISSWRSTAMKSSCHRVPARFMSNWNQRRLLAWPSRIDAARTTSNNIDSTSARAGAKSRPVDGHGRTDGRKHAGPIRSMPISVARTKREPHVTTASG